MPRLFRVDKLLNDISKKIELKEIKREIRDNIISKQQDIYKKSLKMYETTFKTVKDAKTYKKYKIKKYGHTKILYDKDFWWNRLRMNKEVKNNNIILTFSLDKNYLFYYNDKNFKTKYGKSRYRKWLGIKLIKKILTK